MESGIAADGARLFQGQGLSDGSAGLAALAGRAGHRHLGASGRLSDGKHDLLRLHPDVRRDADAGANG